MTRQRKIGRCRARIRAVLREECGKFTVRVNGRPSRKQANGIMFDAKLFGLYKWEFGDRWYAVHIPTGFSFGYAQSEIRGRAMIAYAVTNSVFPRTESNPYKVRAGLNPDHVTALKKLSHDGA